MSGKNKQPYKTKGMQVIIMEINLMKISNLIMWRSREDSLKNIYTLKGNKGTDTVQQENPVIFHTLCKNSIKPV